MVQPEQVALAAWLALSGAHAFAADHRPLPRGAPEQLVAVAPRVNVVAQDELDPDRLRALARPGVVLWLKTRTNVLRASTLELLNRFDESFVQLRAPVTESQARSLGRAPRAGLWLERAQLGGQGLAALRGPRPLAVQVTGRFDAEVAEAVAAQRPSVSEWRSPLEPDLMSWALFRQLPGRKLVTLEPGQLLPVACPGRGDSSQPSLRAHVASLLALASDAFPCGPGERVIVDPSADRWLIQSVLVRDASAELEFEVGADDKAAARVCGLLDALGLPRR